MKSGLGERVLLYLSFFFFAIAIIVTIIGGIIEAIS